MCEAAASRSVTPNQNAFIYIAPCAYWISARCYFCLHMPPIPALHKVPPEIVNLADHERTHASIWTTTPGPTSAAVPPTKSPCAPTAAPGTPCRCGRACCGRWRAATPGSACWAARWRTPFCWPHCLSAPGPPRRRTGHGLRGGGAGRGRGAQHPGQRAAGGRCAGSAARPGRGPLWFQLYLQHDRGFTQALVQRAEAAGYEALVLTVDAPTSGVRDRERRAGFRLPPGVGPVNLAGLQAPLQPNCAPAKARCLTACCTKPPPGTTSPGCSPSPACPCCSRACCTRPTRARPWRRARRA
jgi:4-hydroxymandelate oxidase